MRYLIPLSLLALSCTASVNAEQSASTKQWFNTINYAKIDSRYYSDNVYGLSTHYYFEEQQSSGVLDDYGYLDTDSNIGLNYFNSDGFSLGTNTNVVGDNKTYVGWQWKKTAGVFDIQIYTGNGNADGPFIYLGFKPAWLMIKNIDATYNWAMYDNKRSPYNSSTIKALWADTTDAEGSYSTVDFLSNGVKMRGDSTGTNASGDTYIYMAFAETPFKYSNAR